MTLTKLDRPKWHPRVLAPQLKKWPARSNLTIFEDHCEYNLLALYLESKNLRCEVSSSDWRKSASKRHEMSKLENY